jgi:hypothetical protein
LLFCSFWFSLAVLEFELWALYFITWATYPLFYLSGCFPDRVFHFSPGLVLDCNPPTYTSHIAGIIGTYCHSQLLSSQLACLSRWGGLNFLSGQTSNHHSSGLCLPSSWGYNVSHHAQLHFSLNLTVLSIWTMDYTMLNVLSILKKPSLASICLSISL